MQPNGTASQSARRGRRSITILLAFIAGALLTGALIAVLATSSLARRADLPFERAVAGIAKAAVIPASASSLTPPGPLDDRRVLARGREAFNGSCAVCHGATGDGQGRFGALMYPPASDLRAAETQGRSDGQLFWIVQNGLSFVGMPAFRDQYPDELTWALVGYVRALGRGDAPAGNIAPSPTDEHLAVAHPFVPESDRRGAAVFFEQGCYMCHGPRGDAIGNMALRPTKRGLASADRLEATLRDPPQGGMPRFSPKVVDEGKVADLYAYIQTLYPPAGG